MGISLHELAARDGLHRIDPATGRVNHPDLTKALLANPKAAVRAASMTDVPLLYWTAAAWGAAISLSKDTPELVAQIPAMEALMDRALAAREGRLLTLSTLTDLLKGRGQVLARVFSRAFAAGISVFLCVAAAQLVQTEKEAGKILSYGIPLWTGLQPPIASDTLVLPALLTLLLAVVLGAPIFVLLGGAALILFWGQDLPIASISLTHYSMVTNPTLPTVPLFTLAGSFGPCLDSSAAGRRLSRCWRARFSPHSPAHQA